VATWATSDYFPQIVEPPQPNEPTALLFKKIPDIKVLLRAKGKKDFEFRGKHKLDLIAMFCAPAVAEKVALTDVDRKNQAAAMMQEQAGLQAELQRLATQGDQREEVEEQDMNKGEQLQPNRTAADSGPVEPAKEQPGQEQQQGKANHDDKGGAPEQPMAPDEHQKDPTQNEQDSSHGSPSQDLDDRSQHKEHMKGTQSGKEGPVARSKAGTAGCDDSGYPASIGSLLPKKPTREFKSPNELSFADTVYCCTEFKSKLAKKLPEKAKQSGGYPVLAIRPTGNSAEVMTLDGQLLYVGTAHLSTPKDLKVSMRNFKKKLEELVRDWPFYGHQRLRTISLVHQRPLETAPDRL